MGNRIELRIRVADADDLAAASSVAQRTADLEFEQSPTTAAAAHREPNTSPDVVMVRARPIVCATFIKDWWAERDAGLVIDQRLEVDDDIARDTGLPYGYVVVYLADRQVAKVDVTEAPKDAVERWFCEVMSGRCASIRDLTELVAGAPGSDNIRVVSEPS